MIATEQKKTRVKSSMRRKHKRNVAAIEEQIRPLSSADKLDLIQAITEMLREDTDEQMLERLRVAAAATDPCLPGPIEAYEAASQLQTLLKQERE